MKMSYCTNKQSIMKMDNKKTRKYLIKKCIFTNNKR